MIKCILLLSKKTCLFALLALTFFASCKKNDSSGRNAYNINNSGVAGNTSTNLVSRVKGDVISLKPSLVIILIGTNDALGGKYFSGANFRANMVTLITQLQAAHAKVLLLSPPPHGTDTIPGNNPVNNNLDTVAAIMNTLSTEYNCYYYDLHAAVLATGTPNASFSSLILNNANSPSRPDGIHFTLPGTAFLAAHVYDFMKANQYTGFYKIVCFGDSITVEYGDNCYPSQLQYLLNNG